MPDERRTPSVGISSSVAVFLLFMSVCCMLSLSSKDNHENRHKQRDRGSGGNDMKWIVIPDHVPNFAMISVMSIGILVMVVFMFKRRDLTTQVAQSISRHDLHSKFSLWSITAFFVGVCVLGINYILAEISCGSKWTVCDHNEMEIMLVNASNMVFHIVFVAFASCETIVCWALRGLNIKRSQLVWHGLAVVQAANIALWFDSVLTESHHRNKNDADIFIAYFTFCNATKENRNDSEADEWCSESIVAKWFVMSIPYLFPITIEFSLLVSETFLDKSIGAESNGFNENDVESVVVPESINHRRCSSAEDSTELTPLRSSSRNENSNPESTSNSTNSSRSNIFILISVIINIVYLVLTILLFIGEKSVNDGPYIKDQSQTYNNIFAVYSVGYEMFSITCCIVGIHSCRTFKRHRSHTSFLEYLLLFATSGVLFQSIKRLVAFAVRNASDNELNIVYYLLEFLDMTQALLQIVFYYYAKDVKLRTTNNGGRADSPTKVFVLKCTMVVISITNFATWISDSFLLPELSTSVTPSEYSIEQWPVFDNVVTPIVIFFRFNCALLFWCIATDVFRPGELHEE